LAEAKARIGHNAAIRIAASNQRSGRDLDQAWHPEAAFAGGRPALRKITWTC